MKQDKTHKTILQEIISGLFEGVDVNNDSAVVNAKNDIMAHLYGNNGKDGVLNTDNDISRKIRAVGRNIGVNVDYNPIQAARIKNKASGGQEINQSVMDDVKKAIQILRQYIQKSSAAGAGYTINYNRMAKDLPKEEVDFVAKMQDFIDSQGMEWTYNPSITKRKDSKTYGIKADGDDLNFDDFNFNVSYDSPEFKKYRADSVGAFKYIPIGVVPSEFMDEVVTLPYVPDNSKKTKIAVDFDSPLYIEVDGAYYVLVNTKDKKILTDSELKQKMLTSILDKYMMSKYGLAVSLPASTFSAGNAKLPNSTLIINFTSAQRCPAWAECLVKNACYARAGEKLHNNVFQANSQRNLMWEAGLADPNMMVLIENLLRTYIIDYSTLRKNLIAARKNIQDKKVTLQGVPSIDVLRKLKFSEYSNEELEIVKTANRGIKNIRLNENGDFINQALLDKIDEICGDIKLLGIQASAYTCRLLNYNKIKNIIINASRDYIGRNAQNNTVANAIARYFIALPESIYDAFDDTYSGPNNSININSKSEVLKPNLQPLYAVEGDRKVPTGNFYYKCPCGRGFDGKPHEASEDKKINCYQCNLCYEPSEKPYYVFVRVHGGAASKLEEKPLAYGESLNFRENYLNLNKKEYVAPIQKDKNGNLGLIAEVFDLPEQDDYAEKCAIECISNNAIYSVNTHLNGLFTSQQQKLQEHKQSFNSILDRMNNTEF